MDDEGFGALWGECYPRIRYYISHSFPTLAPEASDLTQEVFARAFAAIGGFDDDRPAAPWLYAVARNLCVDHLRRSARSPAPASAEELESAPGPEPAEHERLDREDRRGRIAAAIESLEPADREICFLYYFEDMGIARIARLSDKPEGTVKYRLFRIRAALRGLLEAVHEE